MKKKKKMYMLYLYLYQRARLLSGAIFYLFFSKNWAKKFRVTFSNGFSLPYIDNISDSCLHSPVKLAIGTVELASFRSILCTELIKLTRIVFKKLPKEFQRLMIPKNSQFDDVKWWVWHHFQKSNSLIQVTISFLY